MFYPFGFHIESAVFSEQFFNNIRFLDLFSVIGVIAQAVATIYAVIIAKRAYEYSETALAHTELSNLFNTQITILKLSLNDEKIQHTQLKTSQKKKNNPNKNSISSIGTLIKYKAEKKNSVFKSFCEYFKHNIPQNYKSEFTPREICNIWKTFCDNLHYKSEFEASFKYIYQCVNTVDKEKLSEVAKQGYIRAVSDIITSEQLFCYFINLVEFCDGDCTTDPTVELLRKYRFFDDLFRSSIFKDIRPVIPVHIVKCFQKN